MLKSGSTTARGRMVTTQYLLTPNVVFSNQDAGGLNALGAPGGYFGGAGALAGSLMGSMRFRTRRRSSSSPMPRPASRLPWPRVRPRSPILAAPAASGAGPPALAGSPGSAATATRPRAADRGRPHGRAQQAGAAGPRHPAELPPSPVRSSLGWRPVRDGRPSTSGLRLTRSHGARLTRDGVSQGGQDDVPTWYRADHCAGTTGQHGRRGLGQAGRCTGWASSRPAWRTASPHRRGGRGSAEGRHQPGDGHARRDHAHAGLQPVTLRWLYAGIGFGIASIYKFRQHKKNPTELKVQVSGRNNANVTLTKQRLASYKLGEPLAPVEVKVTFKAPLTFRGSMAGRPTTVTFTSIRGRSLTLAAE